MHAQIAFQRLSVFRDHGNLHCPKRASHHTALAANAARLLHPPDARLRTNCLGWAHIRAGCVFALMTRHRSSKCPAFYHPDTRRERHGSNGCAILRVLMRNHAGHFAGATTNALFRISNNKPVHLFTPPARLKPQSAREVRDSALIKQGKGARFVAFATQSGFLPDV
jgi:hypothetical protein